MKAVEVVISEKNEIATMKDEDLIHQYGRVVALEKMIREMKKMLRDEIIARYGVPAEHVVGDYKVIIEEKRKLVLDTKAVKNYLQSVGKLDDFMKESKSVYIYVR